MYPLAVFASINGTGLRNKSYFVPQNNLSD
jgi:hypothetical protein